MLKKIIWITILLSQITPLLINNKMMVSFGSFKALFFMGITQIMFFFWIILALKDKNYRPKKNIVVFFAFLFLLSAILSTIFGADPFFSFWSNYQRMMGLLTYIHLFIFFLVLSSFIQKQEDWLNVIFFTAPVASIISLISIASRFNIFETARDGSTIGNTSFMGSYFIFAAFFSLYAIFKTKKYWKYFYIINFILISLGIIFNPGGRAMRGSLLIGLVLFLTIYFSFKASKEKTKKLFRFLLISGFLLFFFISASSFIENSFVGEKVRSLDGMNARFIAWDKAWLGAKERPLLGWGPENYDIVFEKYFGPGIISKDGLRQNWWDRAHNIVFDSLVSFGILGTICFFGMFFSALFLLWREYFKDNIDFWAPSVFSSMFVAYFIQNLTIFDMIISSVFIFIFLSFSASLDSQKITEKKFSFKSKIIIIAFILPLLMTSFYHFIFLTYKSNIIFVDSLMSPVGEKNNVEKYEKTLKGNVNKRQTIMLLAEKTTIYDKKRDLNKIEDLNERTEKRERILKELVFLKKEMESMVEKYPERFKERWTLGRLYNGYFDYYYIEQLNSPDLSLEERNKTIIGAKDFATEARNHLLKAIELIPGYRLPYFDLAQSEINIGKIYFMSLEVDLAYESFFKAIDHIEKTIEIDPYYFESHLNIIMIARDILIDPDLVREKAIRAININPLWRKQLMPFI